MAKRIVIADDSATIQRAFAMTFGAEDVTLIAARSADEGLNLVRQIQPEMVIADGMMPGRSGYDLCAAIKSDPALGDTAVYILASAQQPYDESRGRQSGADGHFVKPFDTSQIIEKVHDALARGPVEKAQPAPVAVAVAPVDDFGPPAPLEVRSTIPQGLSTPLAAADDDDEYGEISVEMSPAPAAEDEAGGEREREAEYAAAPSTPAPLSRGGLGTPPPYTPAPVAPAAMFQPPTPAPMATAASMRPSLIPGIRPGAVAPARPGAAPAGSGPGPVSRPPAPVSRTLMGLPAANIPIPGTSRPGIAPPIARPSPAPSPSSSARPAPVAPAPAAATPAPLFSSAAPAAASPLLTPRPAVTSPPPTVSSVVSAAVASAVDQKIAAIGARGPEYEAIARLSREIIEQIVWEVVPELAEVIIREHVERHVRN
jgi:CheY-like chemotaxis protein